MIGVVRNLGIPTLLGASFIGKCIKGIFSTDRKTVPLNSSPVSILVVLEASKVGTTKQLTETATRNWMLAKQEPDLVRVAHTVAFQPLVEIPVLVASSSSGLL